MMQTQTLLRKTTFSVGICALVELESTLCLVSQILTSNDEGLQLKEVIVVTPNPIIANKLANMDPRLVVVLEERREGKIVALRKILKRATGEVLVLPSADIRVGRYSIPQLVRALASDPNLGVVDSQVELVNGEAKLADRVSIFLWELHNEMLEQLDDEGRLGHVAGDLIAVRRELLGTLPDFINDDAYIALETRRKGYVVRRVPNTHVWIAGPRTPADYVSQRCRVITGHLQLIRVLGVVPTTFEFTLPIQPIRNLRVLARVLRKLGPSYLPTFTVSFLLELISFNTALFQFLTRRKQTPWRIVYSTKRV